MRRREFLRVIGGGAAAWPVVARAQPAGKVWRVGMLDVTSAALNVRNIDAFRAGMRTLGYVEGQNLVIDYRSVDGRLERLPELVAELIREGKIELTTPIERTVTYHDPCRLNKRLGKWQSPREILRAIPGLTFVDVDHVTQWSYCSGAGANLAAEKPELTAEISRRRVAKAAALEGVNTLVSACPWSERPLSEQGKEQGIEVFDIFELVAEAAGFEV